MRGPDAIQPLELFWASEKGVCTRERATDGSWSPEQNLGGVVSPTKPIITASRVPDSDTLQLFYVGPDNAVKTCWL
jgi:hypothetical protein